jgi:hypothetical protein
MSKLNKTIKLVVKGGVITGIYDDALVPLLDQAESVETVRASNVEPHMTQWGDGRSYWQADLSPVGGPTLTGFTTRQEALDAEVQYLNRHVVR